MVAPVVGQQPQEGVQRAAQPPRCAPVGNVRHFALHAPQGGIADIAAAGLEEGTKERYTLTHIANDRLILADLQREPLFQELSHLRSQREQPPSVCRHHIEVVDIAPEVTGDRFMSHIFTENNF